MKVWFNIATGPSSSPLVRKRDMDKNIAAVERFIDGKPLGSDYTLLIDTKSILEGIRNQLPD
jgi:hypothetical protein